MSRNMSPRRLVSKGLHRNMANRNPLVSKARPSITANHPLRNNMANHLRSNTDSNLHRVFPVNNRSSMVSRRRVTA
jgi:hypothetical protein